MREIREFKQAEEKIKAMLKSKDIHGCIFIGEAGMGKTYIAEKVLKEEKANYVCVNSYSTPLALYIKLFENRDKIILFDDAVNILNNSTTKSMLLAGLWGEGTEKREIQYNSTTKILDEKDIPQSFSFTGMIIWCCNHIPKKIEPLLSRCYFHKFEWDFKTKHNIVKQICELNGVPKEIQEFIKKQCTPFCTNFDFRLPKKIMGYYKQGGNWKENALSELEYDDELWLVCELSRKYKSEKARREFVKETGLSRATFQRYRRRLGLSRGYKCLNVSSKKGVCR